MRGALRSLPVLAALLALAAPGTASAAAAGGSASCTVPFEIARHQQLGELNRVRRRALAQIVRNHPQVQRALVRRVAADAPDVGRVLARGHEWCRHFDDFDGGRGPQDLRSPLG